MINIIINGKTFKVNSNLTVLEAALQSGIYIPHLCYHPDLTPTGACRLCIVEIEGIRGYPPSCATKVSEGMKIKTETAEITKMRKHLIWLLLSNYPDTYPQNTLLRKVIDHIGTIKPLKDFKKTPRNLPIRENEPLFTINPNLCILCERCVRICHDIRGAGILGYINRGIDTTVTTAYNLPLRDVDCRFCRACVEVCPSGALADKERYSEEDRELKLLPCKNTCPASIDIPRYLRLISERRYQDSINVIRQTVPLPHVLGLVCTHPCERVCLRNEVSEPIAINALKRFVAERDDKTWKDRLQIKNDTGKKIAVVGSGPAGLTAAWFLRLKGHSVTIFEQDDTLGGSMRLIPQYRLPHDILDKEIQEILSIGINVKINTKINTIDELKEQKFDAIFLALGTNKPVKLGIEGEEDHRVIDGLGLLRTISKQKAIQCKGLQFIVIGGGNVAIDVSRSLLRLGAKKVAILYRRTRNEMPAHEEEIREALHEGVEIQYLVSPIKIRTSEEKLIIECIRMQLGDPDEKGRRQPKIVPGSEFSISADRLIVAIGQSLDPLSAIKISNKNLIEVDKNLQTNIPGVFAGGDAVSGPLNVISAIKAGRLAASAIDKYLGGNGDITFELIPPEEDNPWMGREEGFGYVKREPMPTTDLDKRLEGFQIVEKGLSEESAIKEAKRCLKCQIRLSITRPKINF
ncbi:MAG: FAD-dependent oxidoreductase [Thermodesulfovibrionales bacterium]|nr:FAD-dependent oxidoreductase [Thermodesulfovibrionales bacterium]